MATFFSFSFCSTASRSMSSSYCIYICASTLHRIFPILLLLILSFSFFFLYINPIHVHTLTRSTAETKTYPSVHERNCPKILFFSSLDTYAVSYSLVSAILFFFLLLFSSHFFPSSNTIIPTYVQGYCFI